MRELRRERGLTLKALGRAAGLSHPFLSQLERGLALPSIVSVERIARALDVPVGTLWASPPIAGATVVRAHEGAVTAHTAPDAPGGVREILSGGSVLRMREWSGGSTAWADEAESTAGGVCVYVVRGVLEIDLGGKVHSLREGDAVLFDGAVPHRMRRRGGPRTRALYVATG